MQKLYMGFLGSTTVECIWLCNRYPGFNAKMTFVCSSSNADNVIDNTEARWATRLSNSQNVQWMYVHLLTQVAKFSTVSLRRGEKRPDIEWSETQLEMQICVNCTGCSGHFLYWNRWQFGWLDIKSMGSEQRQSACGVKKHPQRWNGRKQGSQVNVLPFNVASVSCFSLGQMIDIESDLNTVGVLRLIDRRHRLAKNSASRSAYSAPIWSVPTKALLSQSQRTFWACHPRNVKDPGCVLVA